MANEEKAEKATPEVQGEWGARPDAKPAVQAPAPKAEKPTELDRLMSKAIPFGDHGFDPKDSDQLQVLATKWVKSGTVPTNWTHEGRYDNLKPLPVDQQIARTVIAIDFAASVGIGRYQAAQVVYFVNNVPNLHSNGPLMAAMAMGAVSRPPQIVFEGNDDNDQVTDKTVCVCTAWRKGQEEPVVVRYAISDANRAGLLGRGPWKSNPKDMLRWKAMHRALKQVAADALAGVPFDEDEPEAPVPTQAPAQSTADSLLAKLTA